MALAAYVPYDGSHATVWPSWRTLKQTCGVSNDRLNRALRELVDVGAITIKRGSRRRSQEYTLLFVAVPDAIRAAAENRPRLVAESKGSKPAPQRTLYPASVPRPSAPKTGTLSAPKTGAPIYLNLKVPQKEEEAAARARTDFEKERETGREPEKNLLR